MRLEDVLVGLIALALLPLIAWRIRRGVRNGRLPLYRNYIDREAGPVRFGALLALHMLSFFLVAAVAAELLLNLGLRDRL